MGEIYITSFVVRFHNRSSLSLSVSSYRLSYASDFTIYMVSFMYVQIIVYLINFIEYAEYKFNTGAPDAQLCTASDKAWMMPDNYTCNAMECYIELEFSFNVIPNK